jgi:THO complex subunit 2
LLGLTYNMVYEEACSLPSASLVETCMKKELVQRSALAARKEWKRIFLTALSFGTDYPLPLLQEDEGMCDDDDMRPKKAPTVNLKIRAQKTLSFLQDTIAKFDSTSNQLCTQSSFTRGRDAASIDGVALEKVDVARLGLADALWVVGQFVCSPDQTSLKVGEDTMKNDQENDESLRSLLHIVQGLSGKRPDQQPTSQITSRGPTLPASLLQMVLDPQMLGKSDVAPTYDIFSRRYVKFQTNVLYRQKRFNLLAEESEGWAKVITFLCSMPQISFVGSTAGQQEDAAGSCSHRVSGMFLHQFRAYIGTFDLDPNRVLAVLLDILEEELKWTILNNESSTTTFGGTSVTLDILLQLISQFKVSALPHLLGFLLIQNSLSATPVLGTETNGSSAEQEIPPSDTAPKSFFSLVAFLLAHDIVDAKALFPYFAPTGNHAKPVPEMLEIWSKKRQMEVANEIKEWGVVSLSAVPSNTATDNNKDSTAGKTGGAAEKAEARKSVKEECVLCPIFHLMDAVLSFGGWAPFMKLLTLCRFPPKLQKSSPSLTSRTKPFDVDLILLFPPIGRSICEVVRGVLEEKYPEINCDQKHADGGKGPRESKTMSPLRNKCRRLSNLIPAHARLESLLRASDCILDDHLLEIVFDPVMMLATSHEAVRDFGLWAKLCELVCSSCSTFQRITCSQVASVVGGTMHPRRSGKTQIAEHTSTIACKMSKLILQWFLLPSLSIYPPDSSSRELLWSALSVLPYTDRYAAYDTWAWGAQTCLSKGTLKRDVLRLERQAISQNALRGAGCDRVDKRLWAVRTEVVDGKATRAVLKRLAKETIKQQGEQFAKVSSTSPIVAFKILIQQMQAYDNMIELMVDSFRQCSDLARDVLVWCILRNLEGPKSGAASGKKTI